MQIVMTGATAGIGLVAARRCLGAGADLVVGARDAGKAPEDLRRSATLRPLDLGDLNDVTRFAEAVEIGRAHV